MSQSGETPAEDLAGLTPQDISRSLQDAIGVVGLNAQNESSLMDMIYKAALVRQANAQAGRFERGAEPVFTIPGTNVVLSRDEYLEWYKTASKDERTAAIKNFEYARDHGYSGSFEDFQGTAKTTHQKDYEAAVKGGYEGKFNEWLLEMRKAGAINLGDIKARAGLKGQLYFKDPEWVDDLNRYMSSNAVRDQLLQYEGDMETEAARYRVKFIESRIVAGGGVIKDVEFDGNTMTWTVLWPSEDTEPISYEVRN